jgi:molybdenum cofactor biosynthesis enzyme MoaA
MKTDVIIAHPNTQDEIKALKAFLKALNIKFEISESIPDTPLSQQQKDILDQRRIKAKPSDFISAEEVNNRLKKKYGV